MLNRIKFTRSVLDRLPLPAPGGRFEYQDQTCPALILRVTSTGMKTFCTRGKVNGRSIRATIGVYMGPGDVEPRLSVEQARRAATKARAQVADGVDPGDAKRARRVAATTFDEALTEYLRANQNVKDSTRKAYRYIANYAAPDWLSRPIREITPERFLNRYLQVGQRSQARANQFAAVLRALWNSLAADAPVTGAPPYGPNPVTVLRTRRAWFKKSRRRTRLRDHELPQLWAGIRAMRELDQPSSEDAADLYTFLMLTGMRPGECSRLEWRHVDLVERVIAVPDAKNGEPYILPLPDVLLEVLERRHGTRIGPFVFACARYPDRAFPRQTLHRYKQWLWEETGLQFCPYDLRRGFSTVAESLDLSTLTIKRLMNHRTAEADVTSGYIGRDPRRLAVAMQRVCDRFMELATRPANVVELRPDRRQA